MSFLEYKTIPVKQTHTLMITYDNNLNNTYADKPHNQINNL